MDQGRLSRQQSVRLAAVACAAAVAFLVFPSLLSQPLVLNQSMLLRGLLAGLVAGMSLNFRGRVIFPVLCASTGSAVGGLLLLFGAPRTSLALVLAAATLSAIVAAVLTWLRTRLPRFATMTIALVLVLACQVWSVGLVGVWKPTAEYMRTGWNEPLVDEQYSFDGAIYLRTLQLMQDGQPYYVAFQEAWTADERLDGTITTPLNFREPALFYAWKLLPGTSSAGGLWLWFVAFTLLIAVASWLLASTFVSDGPALLAPIALLSYYSSFATLRSMWFTFMEVWAAGVLLIALLLLMRGKWTLSAVALVLAVAVRELAIIFVPVWIVAWLLSGRRRSDLPALAIASLGSLVPLALHWTLAPAAGGTGAAAVRTWLQGGGVARLNEALLHASKVIPYYRMTVPLLAALATIGALRASVRWQRWALLTAIGTPALFLAFLSSGPNDYYWGALLTPLVLALAPLVFSRSLPPATPPSSRESSPSPRSLVAERLSKVS